MSQGLIHLTVADELGSVRATTRAQGIRMQTVIEEQLTDLAPQGALWLSFAGMFDVAPPFLKAAIGDFHRQGKPVYGEQVFITDATMDTILLIEDAADKGDRDFSKTPALSAGLLSEPVA